MGAMTSMTSHRHAFPGETQSHLSVLASLQRVSQHVSLAGDHVSPMFGYVRLCLAMFGAAFLAFLRSLAFHRRLRFLGLLLLLRYFLRGCIMGGSVRVAGV